MSRQCLNCLAIIQAGSILAVEVGAAAAGTGKGLGSSLENVHYDIPPFMGHINGISVSRKQNRWRNAPQLWPQRDRSNRYS